MSSILVTGGAGFIGSHLVEALLATGHQVGVIDDFNDFYDPALKRANLAPVLDRVTLHELDLRETRPVLEAVGRGGYDTIIHLAARAGVGPSLRQPQLYVDTNITGTLNLLEAARLGGVGRFIFASSSSVYGLAATMPFREDMPLLQTISPYAATKLAGEQLCANYAHLYGIRMVCLRFFNAYGPRLRPDLAIYQFTSRIHRGRTIDVYGDGSMRRDFTHIDDTIQGVVAALRHISAPDDLDAVFDIFNLGESATTSVNELIGMIEVAVGRKAVVNRLPERPGDVPRTYADISKARRELGYQPLITITEGIPLYVEWYLSTLEGGTPPKRKRPPAAVAAGAAL